MPPVELVGGNIAYVNPKHILLFIIAHELKLDVLISDVDFVPSDDKIPMLSPPDPQEKIYHISECQELKCLMHAKIEILKTRGETERGRKPRIRIIFGWITDWRDGFGPSKVKNNRKSVVAWTISFSTPKENVNSTSNTFLFAVGMKDSAGWPEVEHRFRKDSECFKEPLSCYRGGDGKMLQAQFVHMLSMMDRPEKAAITDTINYSSDHHYWFGNSIHLKTPRVKSEQELKAFLKREAISESDSHRMPAGWSDQFIDRESSLGGKLSSCLCCRQRRVNRMLFSLSRGGEEEEEEQGRQDNNSQENSSST